MLDVWYEVDRDNRLCRFSANWDASASDTRSVALLSSRLLGMPLLEFINGDVSAMFIETMITSARVQQKELIRLYRCDSPTHRREMRTVTRRGERKIKRCSMCNDLQDAEAWLTQDAYLARHPHLKGEELPVYYGICPRCARRGTEAL